MLFVFGLAVSFILESHGSGVHMWDLTYYDFVQVEYVRHTFYFYHI